MVGLTLPALIPNKSYLLDDHEMDQQYYQLTIQQIQFFQLFQNILQTSPQKKNPITLFDTTELTVHHKTQFKRKQC